MSVSMLVSCDWNLKIICDRRWHTRSPNGDKHYKMNGCLVNISSNAVNRYQSSSQDSSASSLPADKMSQRPDVRFASESLHPKSGLSTNRRKRLVRQFSLWVHIAHVTRVHLSLHAGALEFLSVLLALFFSNGNVLMGDSFEDSNRKKVRM